VTPDGLAIARAEGVKGARLAIMQLQCTVNPMRRPCFAEALLFKKSVPLAYQFADAMIAVSPG
jgi:hypothetical protein